nr:GNAT family N-acetyltransferase [Bacteroidota bacterium]
MIRIKAFDISDTGLYRTALGIRRKVFIQGQHVDPALEIENEPLCRHYLLYLNDNPVGTARWRKTAKGIKLERFAVLEKFRNNGYGTVMLEKVLDDILPMGYDIYLHSQLPAAGYYERKGFIQTGEVFCEAGIDHFLMIRKVR